MLEHKESGEEQGEVPGSSAHYETSSGEGRFAEIYYRHDAPLEIERVVIKNDRGEILREEKGDRAAFSKLNPQDTAKADFLSEMTADRLRKWIRDVYGDEKAADI